MLNFEGVWELRRTIIWYSMSTRGIQIYRHRQLTRNFNMYMNLQEQHEMRFEFSRVKHSLSRHYRTWKDRRPFRLSRTKTLSPKIDSSASNCKEPCTMSKSTLHKSINRKRDEIGRNWKITISVYHSIANSKHQENTNINHIATNIWININEKENDTNLRSYTIIQLFVLN